MTARQTEFSLTVSICAWCKPAERGSSPGTTSHGICLRHLRKLKLETQGLLPIRSRKSASQAQRRQESGEEILLAL